MIIINALQRSASPPSRCIYLTDACLRRSADSIQTFSPCYRREGGIFILDTLEALGCPYLPGELTAMACACYNSLSASLAPRCQTALLDQNSRLIWWHASTDFKHQLPLQRWQIWRGEKQQWSFNKLIMKTNGPSINHLLSSLKKIPASSDTERTGLSLKSWRPNPWMDIQKSLRDPQGLRSRSMVRFPRIRRVVVSAPAPYGSWHRKCC